MHIYPWDHASMFATYIYIYACGYHLYLSMIHAMCKETKFKTVTNTKMEPLFSCDSQLMKQSVKGKCSVTGQPCKGSKGSGRGSSCILWTELVSGGKDS